MMDNAERGIQGVASNDRGDSGKQDIGETGAKGDRGASGINNVRGDKGTPSEDVCGENGKQGLIGRTGYKQKKGSKGSGGEMELQKGLKGCLLDLTQRGQRDMPVKEAPRGQSWIKGSKRSNWTRKAYWIARKSRTTRKCWIKRIQRIN